MVTFQISDQRSDKLTFLNKNPTGGWRMMCQWKEKWSSMALDDNQVIILITDKKLTLNQLDNKVWDTIFNNFSSGYSSIL